MTATLTTTLSRGYDESVAAVRGALADQGFGILTEIDIRTTLREKLGVEVPAQVILGACRPPLAHRALEIQPSVAAMLPCNVVVRAVDADTTVVEAADPDAMMAMFDDEGLREVAAEARERIAAALASLDAA